MSDYKDNKELIDFLLSKNLIIKDKKFALDKLEKYSYYLTINSYKHVFKDISEEYNYIPPFVLVKILTLGCISK